jgi:ABC-type thiamine transport system substrate-binding protein
MKKTFALFFSLFVFLAANSQVQNPIKWSATYTSFSNGEGEIIITGIIEKGWHTYSQQPNEAVPLPTLISFKESENYQLLGEAIEKNAQEEYDATLGKKLLVFVDKAEFKQKVQLKAKGPQIILFTVEYISCDNKMCLPPTTIDLNVKIQ